MARRVAGDSRLASARTRRPTSVASTTAGQASTSQVSANPAPDYTRRMDALVELVDHCTAAKESADALGEKFLAYLLAMAIQESRAAMRATVVSPNARSH